MDLALLPELSLKTHRSLVPSVVTMVLTRSLGHSPSLVLVHSCGYCLEWKGVSSGSWGPGLWA